MHSARVIVASSDAAAAFLASPWHCSFPASAASLCLFLDCPQAPGAALAGSESPRLLLVSSPGPESNHQALASVRSLLACYEPGLPNSRFEGMLLEATSYSALWSSMTGLACPAQFLLLRRIVFKIITALASGDISLSFVAGKIPSLQRKEW